MNEDFKKLEELANHLTQSNETNRMPVIMLATSRDSDAMILCNVLGVGHELIEMLTAAFDENRAFMSIVKKAIAFVEGGDVMTELAVARKVQSAGKDICSEGKQPCGDACNSGEQDVE